MTMPTATTSDDPTAASDLLSLAQWVSPAFPLGGFAYSHGLEQAVSTGDVTDAAGFDGWLRAVLDHGSGRADAILLALAHRGGEAAALAALAQAMAPSRERWQETWAQGCAFVRTTNAILGTDLAPCALPVAVGVQARALKLPTATVAGFYLHAFAGNLTTIATRIVPLGQTAAQGVLAGLAGTIAAIAADAAIASEDDLASGAPGADLAAMLHETQEVRLFQS
jgi:urease accessory protein